MNENVTERKRCLTTLPSDMDQIRVVAKYDILKYLRSKRLIGIIAIEVLVLVLITAIPPLLGNSFGKNPDVFINVYANFTGLLAVIGATLFAGDAIVSEFQGRTGYLLFPNPVKRSVLLAGKFIASVGAMFIVLFVYYGAALVLGLVLTGGFSTLGVESLLLAMLASIGALAIGYLISSVMKGSTGALILTFALFLFIFTIIQSILSVSNVNPWFVYTFAANTVLEITVSPYPVTTVTTGGGMTITNYVPDVGVSIAVMVAYTAVALVLTYFFFKRREMSA